jgi:hypothetical protein
MGHWQADCPLLIPAADKAEHEARIRRLVERLGDGELEVVAKRRIIKKENQLWKDKQREMASK